MNAGLMFHRVDMFWCVLCQNCDRQNRTVKTGDIKAILTWL